MPIELGSRIIIIGSGGSGKSTLARRLGDMLALPVIHLDKEYWKAGWVETPREEWIIKQQELLAKPEWIMDGNFGGTLEMRLDKADAVIFLDYNRVVCVCSVVKRWLTHIGKTRPDMGEGCSEKIDFGFLKWVWQFPKGGRLKVIEKMSRCQGVTVITVKSRKELKRFLAEI